jgi:uncharacterized integral membrane protein
MRKLLFWIVVAPLAILFVLFAVANRQWVTVSLDPFSREAPAFAMNMPLFIVILGSLFAGVLVGGLVVSFGKMRWRMAAQKAERDMSRLKAETDRAKAEYFSGGRDLTRMNDRIAN